MIYPIWLPTMPESAYALMTDSLSHKKPLFADDFSAALQYKLLTEYSVGYDKYQDISSDLSDRTPQYPAFLRRLHFFL